MGPKSHALDNAGNLYFVCRDLPVHRIPSITLRNIGPAPDNQVPGAA
jgi:hypothetical protein